MKFIIRWIAASLGLWLTAFLLGPDNLNVGGTASGLIIAGLVLAAVNTFIRPFVIFLSIPALLITLGLFMIVLNALLVMLAGAIYDPLHVENIWVAMVAGMLIGLLNYIISRILEDKEE